MATKYYAVLTNVGAAKLANATALGAQVEITQMAVGDGNGVLPTPNPAQTALVHELRRAPLNSLSIDPNNANQIIAEQVIPEDVGGWWIREIGLFDKDGDMIAVANCAETYKPQLQEGSGRVQVVRMILIVSSTAAVTLKIDPSVVLATRAYVDSQIISAKSYADDLMGTHLANANPHDQYPLIANALKEMADAGLVDEVLTNLGLVDTDKLAGRLLAPPIVITASGQFLMPSKGNLFRIRVQGAGGGSGSARATSATGLSASGGGGGGAYVELWLTRAELQALIDVAGGYLDIIIGAGGVGGTGGAGGTGGTTQFGSLIVCPGGKGSDYGIAASTSTTALASGGASSADPVIAIPGLDSSKIILSMAGAPGHFGISVQSPTLAGHGANSPLGNGGVGSGASATQSDGKGYGSGAGGVSNGLSSVAKNGANGGDGVIIVEVYA